MKDIRKKGENLHDRNKKKYIFIYRNYTKVSIYIETTQKNINETPTKKNLIHHTKNICCG